MSGTSNGVSPFGPNASLGIQGIAMGTALESMLMCDEIAPGSTPNYQMCKTIYAYHPLGKRLVDAPIDLAMSQAREITIQGAVEEAKAAFLAEHERLSVDSHIMNTKRLSRIYGISSVALVVAGQPGGNFLSQEQIAEGEITFNVFDPLNTAGSMVLDQDPNSPNFQRPIAVVVQGTEYHRTRCCVAMNEQPLYIEYSDSAFGFVGRSVYQRCLFPLKSFLQTMLTDDMVSQKAGLIVAKMKQAGSIADRLTLGFQALKRAILKGARTYNILNIDITESIESIDLTNVDASMTTSRENIIKNIASGAGQPAKMVADEVFVNGFSEGTEDAKNISHYIDKFREEMAPLYQYFDHIVMARAWTPQFISDLQEKYPETLGGKSFNAIFYSWKNSFKTKWPSLLVEPDSEKIEKDEKRVKAMKDIGDFFLPNLDPANKLKLLLFMQDVVNENEMMFNAELQFDPVTLQDFLEEQKQKEEEAAEAAMQQPGAAGEGGGGADAQNGQPKANPGAAQSQSGGGAQGQQKPAPAGQKQGAKTDASTRNAGVVPVRAKPKPGMPVTA